jgi:hypothetical protein
MTDEDYAILYTDRFTQLMSAWIAGLLASGSKDHLAIVEKATAIAALAIEQVADYEERLTNSDGPEGEG